LQAYYVWYLFAYRLSLLTTFRNIDIIVRINKHTISDVPNDNEWIIVTTEKADICISIYYI